MKSSLAKATVLFETAFKETGVYIYPINFKKSHKQKMFSVDILSNG